MTSAPGLKLMECMVSGLQVKLLPHGTTSAHWNRLWPPYAVYMQHYRQLNPLYVGGKSFAKGFAKSVRKTCSMFLHTYCVMNVKVQIRCVYFNLELSHISFFCVFILLYLGVVVCLEIGHIHDCIQLFTEWLRTAIPSKGQSAVKMTTKRFPRHCFGKKLRDAAGRM